MLSSLTLLFGNASALFLAWLLVDSGWHKRNSANRHYYRGVYASYGLLISERWSGLIALWGWLELAVGVALLVDPLRTVAAPLAAGLLLLYFVAIAGALLRGRGGEDCGCAGPDGALTLTAALLVRNGLLLLLAALAFTAQFSASALLWWQIVPVSAVLWLGYQSLQQLLANRQKIVALL